MYKVLIVDDEMIVRHAVKSLIRWEGSRFEYAGSAASGVSALEMVNRTQPDIIITDIKMSEMDGLELIKQLTSARYAGEVLVLSNYNDFELVREALKCGAHDYMLKLTLKTDEFMSTLEEMALKLDGKRSGDRAPQGNEDTGKASEQAVIQWLKQAHEEMGEQNNSLGRAEVARWFTGEHRGQAFVFDIQAYQQELVQPQATTEYIEALQKIAEGLFPAQSKWWVASLPPNRYSLLAALPKQQEGEQPPAAEELAKRIKALFKSYYNMEIGIVYGSRASTYDELMKQIKLNREADDLSFYMKYRAECIFNAYLKEPIHNDEDFKGLEIQVKDSFHHVAGTDLDLWLESGLSLIQSAADLQTKPSTLKRAIIGGVWGLVNSKIMSSETSWNESAWIRKIELADTDSALMLLLQDLYDEVVTRVGKNPGDQLHLREEIRQAITYLKKHYAQRVVISDIAAHVGFSEPYLCQVFKAETGVSLLTYLNEIRMNKAHEMLSTGNYLIKQVSMEVGIPDPFYFNRLFRKRYGVAPKTIKKNQPS
ncbi:response regulator transcription factor [Paenibacillus senegalimassiliensis]|uniref:response regulator transcription factor n=1 Tax=Paenibacillus senegalimassiliensis TaxID=1737426 RepID=UPI00073E5CA8|nr:response regulator [Paenibacillus senegalimassiliensis]